MGVTYLNENTKISEMEITDEFFMMPETEKGNMVAQNLQNLGEGGVVLVTKMGSSEVTGYITQNELVNAVASGQNPLEIQADEMMNTDFMEVIGDETLGNVLPLISERYPNAIVVIDFNRQCIGYFSRNDYKDALAGMGCYDKSHDPETPEEWRTRGIAMSSKGQVVEALQCYENSLALYADKERAWYELGYNFSTVNRLKDAILCYDRVVGINPNNDDAWINRGNIYSMLRMHDRAVQSFNHALSIDPHNVNALVNLGLALSDQGDIEKAINCYQEAETIKGETAELWYRKGNAYDKANKHKESIKCYDRALELNPQYEDALFNKGAALHLLGKDKKAIKILEEVLRLNPGNESAREAIDICYGK